MANSFGMSPMAYELTSKNLQQAGQQKVVGPLQALATALSGIPQGLASREVSNREEIAQNALAQALGGTQTNQMISDAYRADPALGKTLLGMRANQNNASSTGATGPVGKVYSDLIAMGYPKEIAKQMALGYSKQLGRESGHVQETSKARTLGSGEGTLAYAGDIASEKTLGSERGTEKANWEKFASNFDSSMEMLNDLDNLADEATYTLAGRAYNALKKELGGDVRAEAVARETYKQTVANTLLPRLKETFGGQLSEGERESLLATLGDINSTPEEKKAAVNAFRNEQQRKYEGYEKRFGAVKFYNVEKPNTTILRNNISSTNQNNNINTEKDKANALWDSL